MPVIEVKNLGKRYSIGEHQPYLALRDTLAGIIRSPAQWLRAKAAGNKHAREFWALKDINFQVERGEVLGIIGRNGAGKSTLLKILSRITPPTTGEIRLRGRVSSLLEVGTGFHPELTGRENIFLNGAILGMRNAEIRKKLDAIIEFSGITKFIDTPVKRYSSGMFVRLAFSVAAHLEPDVLIIDEVLAVGDVEFQKRCLGKMEDVTRKEGRTVLFVSHNMTAVRDLCSRTMLLSDGRVDASGPTAEVIQKYIGDFESIKTVQTVLNPDFDKDISFIKIWTSDYRGNITNRINIEEEFRIWVEFNVSKPTNNAEISFCLRNSNNVNVLFASISDSNNSKLVNFQPGKYIASASFRGNFLMPDAYSIRLSAHLRGLRDIDLYQDATHFVVLGNGSPVLLPYGQSAKYLACVQGGALWDFHKIE